MFFFFFIHNIKGRGKFWFPSVPRKFDPSDSCRQIIATQFHQAQRPPGLVFAVLSFNFHDRRLDSINLAIASRVLNSNTWYFIFKHPAAACRHPGEGERNKKKGWKFKWRKIPHQFSGSFSFSRSGNLIRNSSNIEPRFYPSYPRDTPAGNWGAPNDVGTFY